MLLAIALIIGVALCASGKESVLVLLGEDQKRSEVSKLEAYLGATYGNVIVKDAKKAPKQLVEDDEPAYEHLIVLSSDIPYEKEVKEYLGKGGNFLWALSGPIPAKSRNLLKSLGRIVETEKPKPVIDFFLNHLENSQKVRASLPGVELGSIPLYYSGFPHRIDGANQLVFPIMTAAPTAANTNGMIGSDNILASGLAARNDARGTVLGSADYFLDAEFDREIVHRLASWTFGRSGVARIDGIKPKILSKEVDYFRIRDELEVEVCLSHKDANGDWKPFLPRDAQIELTMMTPSIRANLEPSTSNPSCLTTGPVQLPERYGAYSLYFRYQRAGLTHLVAKQPLTVLPYKYDMVPRFEPVLWPYYFAWISQMLSGLLIIVPILVWVASSKNTSAGKKDSEKKKD